MAPPAESAPISRRNAARHSSSSRFPRRSCSDCACNPGDGVTVGDLRCLPKGVFTLAALEPCGESLIEFLGRGGGEDAQGAMPSAVVVPEPGTSRLESALGGQFGVAGG